MSENIFEKALRLKVRFEYRGSISVEDLWDLSLEALNSIYKSLSVQARQVNEDGLLNVRKSEDAILSLKIEIVKIVFETKQAEIEERKLIASKRLKKEKLKEILENRQNEELMNLPASDIQKLIDELDS
jgi:hypothetical protein